MDVEILFFARLRELAGTNSATLQVPAEASVSDALEVIARTYPAIGGSLAVPHGAQRRVHDAGGDHP